MKVKLTLLPHIAALFLGGFPSTLSAWQPGTYPVPPARMQSSGFSVDNQNRNDVIAFWQAVYQESEGYETRVNWTGNYIGTAGSTSTAFVKDVERRINYFRAISGVPSNVHLNTGSQVVIDSTDPYKPPSSTPKSSAAQEAALMLIRNYNSSSGTDLAITHYPNPPLIGWSAATWNANAHGNFAFGLYGPGAVTEYMIEGLSSGSATSSWNTDVGHRRWCIFPPATDFATGDQPGSSAYRPPTNVLYVVQKPSERVTNIAPYFVSYPPAGFFPATVNSPYWSLSCAEADFSSASVKMTDSSGNVVPISNVKKAIGYGDPAIVWQVSAGAAAKYVFNDVTYHVRVSGIGSVSTTQIPASYEYAVTLINPDRLTPNAKISGPAKPIVNQTTAYHFSPAVGVEAIRVVTFSEKSSLWSENAEKPSSAKIIDGTTGGYNLMVAMNSIAGFGRVSGLNSFNLTFPTSYDLIGRGVPEQAFELARQIVPKSTASINFLYRRGYMTKTCSLVVEISSNDGLTWKAVGKPIKGVSNTIFDFNVSKASFPLPKSSAPIRIRFRYFTTGGAIYTHEAAPKSPTGIFIDDITTTHCTWLEQKKITSLATNATQFNFSNLTSGASITLGSKWYLQLQTKLGGKWFSAPMTSATVTAP
ncbi:MAG: hypothetical protein ABI162_07310 [Luteolibacter sp.]